MTKETGSLKEYEIEGKTVRKTDVDFPPKSMMLLGRDTKSAKDGEYLFYLGGDRKNYFTDTHEVIEEPKYWRFNIEKE